MKYLIAFLGIICAVLFFLSCTIGDGLLSELPVASTASAPVITAASAVSPNTDVSGTAPDSSLIPVGKGSAQGDITSPGNDIYETTGVAIVTAEPSELEYETTKEGEAYIYSGHYFEPNPFSVSASSTKQSDCDSFNVDNVREILTDDPDWQRRVVDSQYTAWVSADNLNIGEFLELDFGVLQNDMCFNKITVWNGYGRDEPEWSEYSRVKQLQLYLNDELVSIVSLIDCAEYQYARISLSASAGSTARIKAVVTDIYPGSQYEAVALTKLFFPSGY